MSDVGPELTGLLARAGSGDQEAMERVYDAAYDELRRIATAYLRSRSSLTLNTTALVNEAYLKLFEKEAPSVNDRHHFYALSARAMRQILVDHFRAKSSQKRGSGMADATLDDRIQADRAPGEVVLDVHEALEKLSELDERMARVVELKFFGGLTEAEVASVLGVTTRTISNDWRAARAWLSTELQSES